MANTIQIKRRTSGSGSLSALAVGELGVDLTDSNKLYVGTSGGNQLLNPSASTSYLPLAGGTLTGSLTTGGDITINKGNATLRLNDTTNGHDFVIFSNGSELRMAVNGASFPSAYLNLTTGGNLGLGVTGASERLEVSGKAIFTDAVSVGQSSAPSGNNKFEVYNTSGNYNAVFKNSGQATIEVKGGEASSARIRLIPDEGDDANNADHFQLIHETSNNFELQRYVLNSGWEWKWKLDSSNNVHQTGNLTVGGNIMLTSGAILTNHSSHNNYGFQIKSADASQSALELRDNNNNWRATFYGATSAYGFLDGPWGNWDIRKAVDGVLQIDQGSGLETVLTNATGLQLTGGTLTGDLEVQTSSGGELLIDRNGNSGVLIQQKNNGADNSGSLKIQSGTSTVFTAGGTDILTLTSAGGDLPGDLTLWGNFGANSSSALSTWAGVLRFDTDYSDTARGPNKVEIYNDGSAWIAGLGVHTNTVGFYSGNQFAWYKSNSQTGFVERMALDSDGALLINTTSKGTSTGKLYAGSPYTASSAIAQFNGFLRFGFGITHDATRGINPNVTGQGSIGLDGNRYGKGFFNRLDIGGANAGEQTSFGDLVVKQQGDTNTDGFAVVGTSNSGNSSLRLWVDSGGNRKINAGTTEVISFTTSAINLLQSVTASGTGHLFGKLNVGSVNNSFDFYNNGTSYFNGAVTVDDNLTVAGNLTVTGTISAGSNADTLDNLDSTQFLRSDANDTTTGRLTIANTSGADGLVIAGGENTGISARLFFETGTSGQGTSILNVGGGFQFRTGATAGSSSGTERMHLSSGGTLYPQNNGQDLGTSTKRWELKATSGNFSGQAEFQNKLHLIGLTLDSGGTPSHIKIKTKIPFVSSAADFTVNIKGFQYGSARTVDLKICWHYYNSTFYNATISSAGGWLPTAQLSAEDDNGTDMVCIVLASPGYWPKMYVESAYSKYYGSSTNYFTGWTWTDAAASGTGNKLVTLTYNNKFGNVQATGTLSVSGTSTFYGSLDLQDNDKLLLGNGNDLEIYHDGSHSRIKNTTGVLNVQADHFHLTDGSNSAMSFSVDNDGATDLYYAQSKKFETTSTGATVTGNLSVSGNGVVKQISNNAYATSDLNNWYTGSTATLGQFHRYDATHGHFQDAAGNVASNAPNTLTQSPTQIYSYGALLTLGTTNSFRGQFYMAHSASEIYWRSGWGSSSDQNWTRLVGDRNIQSILNATQIAPVKINGASNMGNSKLIVAGVAQTGVMSDVMSVTVPNTAQNRGGYAIRNTAGGIVGSITGEVVTAGAYPNAVGKIDICVQNGNSSLKGLSIANNGNVSTPYRFTGSVLSVTSTGTETAPTIALGYGYSSAYRLSFYTDTEAGYISNKHGNNGIRFRHRQNTVMQVGYGTDTSTPYVGIGTVIPSASLHIKNANPVIRLEDSDPDGVYGLLDGAGGDFIIAADVGAGSANSFISFRVDGTAASAEKARIDHAGRLGIGESSPWTGLHLKSQTFSGFNGLTYNLTIASSNTYANGHAGGILFAGAYNSSETQTSIAGVWASRPNAGNGQYGGMVHIGGRQHGTSNIPKVINVNHEAVGIGTASPSKKLEIAGGGLRLPNGHSIDWNNENTRILASHASQYIRFDVGGTSNVLYATPTYVSFTAKLIAGSTSTNGGSWLEKNYTGSNKINVLSSHYSSGNTIIGYGVAGKSGSNGYVATYGNFSGGKAALEVANNAFYFKVADSAAQHSIGDDVTLNTRLHVNKNYMTFTSSDGNGLIVNRTSSTAYLQLFPAYSNVPTIMGKGAGGLHLSYNSSSSGIRIDTSNRVGIGTTSPYFKCDIHGGSSVPLRLVSSGYAGTEYHNTAGTWVAYVGTESGGGGNRYNSAASKHTFYNNSSAAVTIDSTGLGIGVTSPAKLLTVQSTTSPIIGLYSTYSDSNARNWAIATNNSAYGDFTISNSSANGGDPTAIKFRLTKEGSVGIGSSPSAKLHIIGDVKVESNGSDANGALINLRHANNNTTDVISTLMFSNSAGSAAKIVGETVGGNTNGVISFHTDNAGTSTEAMRIDSTQRVGIGTGSSAPLSRFNVKGSQGNWRVDTDDVSNEIQVLATTPANDGFRTYRLRTNETIFDTGGSQRFKIASDGDIDISQRLGVGGAHSGSYGLYVHGTSYFGNNIYGADADYLAVFGRARVGYIGHSDYAGFAHRDQSTTTNYALLQGSTGATFLNSASGQTIYFRQGNANVGGIVSGNWGLGTISPGSYKLYVSGTSYLGGNSVLGGNLYFGSTSGSFINQDSSNLRLAGDNGVKLQTYSGGWQDRLVIADDGDIDIAQRLGVGGSHSGSYQLYVNGSARVTSTATINDYLWLKGGLRDDGGDHGTNGQVLSTDGSGAVHWVDQSSGGGGGSGTVSSSTTTSSTTDGEVAIYTASTTVKQAAKLYYNGSDDSLTVGQTSSNGTAQFNVIGDGYFSTRIGVGSSPNSSYSAFFSGDIYSNGDIGGYSKSFRIPHPTKEGMNLRHSSLEGPEIGVYQRGEIQGDTITLPDYWVGLVRDGTVTVQLTPKGSYQKLFVISASNVEIKIGEADGNAIDCYYTVYGERADIERYDVEYEGEI